MNYPTSISEKNDTALLQWIMLQGISVEDAKKILTNQLEFKKNETITKQGFISSNILLLSKGIVKSYLEGPVGKSFSFNVFTPFDYIGISSLYGDKCLFSSLAIVPTTVYMIEKEFFLKLISSNPFFNEYIQHRYYNCQKSLFMKISCRSLKLAVGRLADTLLYLSDDVFKSNLIPHCISRKDIAELSGMSNENAVRILSDFKNDGIVTNSSDGLQIVNHKLLETISVTG